ncbi:MAG TPA: family 43 glycosylhydrolase, partial [Bacteroidales bacterium]|nr:family 43 glycosylhydrolase [Bacteroidales bacterium]
MLFFIWLCVFVPFWDGLSQNPIVPPGIYIADPAAKVWDDGRIYVYGSRDENPGYYCSWKYHVLWSDDLRNWRIAENVLTSKGIGDEIPYSDAILYAPDCSYKDGIYYLYYCLASSENTEGVATSSSPLGPFRKGTVMNPSVLRQIDPAVFIDDDGQAYYVWGQFSAKMAKLKPGMMEIDENTIKDGIVTEKEHFFHEGGYLVKRNGTYYFIYAHMGRANRPTCIGYAMASNVWGPYRYGGVIIDNDHCDPAVWNNHGSIVQFNGKWYVFYHRSTHASNTMRKACLEPITFNEDGTIN